MLIRKLNVGGRLCDLEDYSLISEDRASSFRHYGENLDWVCTF